MRCPSSPRLICNRRNWFPLVTFTAPQSRNHCKMEWWQRLLNVAPVEDMMVMHTRRACGKLRDLREPGSTNSFCNLALCKCLIYLDASDNAFCGLSLNSWPTLLNLCISCTVNSKLKMSSDGIWLDAVWLTVTWRTVMRLTCMYYYMNVLWCNLINPNVP